MRTVASASLAKRCPIDAARHRLRASVYPQLRRVDVHAENGRVRLVGRVRSYFMKQMAHAEIAQIPELHCLENSITVDGC
jgi:hypothetical protein